MTSKFIIKDQGVRASVVTFSSYSVLSIKFNDYNTTSTFNAAVNNIPLIGLATRIDSALRLVQKEMFTQENGARPGVAKVIILLTDGTQTWHNGAENPDRIAKELRNSGIHMEVIGIGENINFDELNDIAGGSGHVFIANTFHVLLSEEFLGKVFSTMCGDGKYLLN